MKNKGMKVITMTAMLIAMSVVIGIFCKNYLNFVGGLLRITFENFPIILSGIMFGPIIGAITGIATDIISYLMSSQQYPLNFIVTIGAGSIGFVAGLVAFLLKNKTKKGNTRIIFSCVSAHVIGSMIIKTAGLFQFYGWVVLWRIPLYLVIIFAETFLICMLYKNSYFRRLIEEHSRNGKEKKREL